jgi:glycosyltransferase involved in cell wall biosynthesis
VVARFEPENLVLEIIRSYLASAATQPLVVVGFEGYPGDYARRIEVAASADDRVRLVGAVWDQSLLDALYAGAASYLHGHTVGGTNPSLLRAMGNEVPIIAYDCPYNRETTADAAAWFRTGQEITDLIEAVERDPDRLFPAVEKARKRAARHYLWEDVVQAYDRLVVDLAGSSQVTTTQAIEQA